MQLYGALVLLVTLSAVCGLQCHVCAGTVCSIGTCPGSATRCGSVTVEGVVTKNCFDSRACNGPVQCCDGELCNSAIPTGSSVLLLLVSSAIMTVFL